ncbi:hypothetical protein BDV93DRAFT_560897 [Ceratobasidium sp. AG-I]|nr:hypothetical protein BDV93DRAFT_560897 [Ceratobasidium sp. AG-I]
MRPRYGVALWQPPYIARGDSTQGLGWLQQGSLLVVEIILGAFPSKGCFAALRAIACNPSARPTLESDIGCASAEFCLVEEWKYFLVGGFRPTHSGREPLAQLNIELYHPHTLVLVPSTNLHISQCSLPSRSSTTVVTTALAVTPASVRAAPNTNSVPSFMVLWNRVWALNV